MRAAGALGVRGVSILGVLAASSLAGCCRTPSPLAPTLRGVSVGAPARGVLVGGVELAPSGLGYRWLRQGGHHFGVPRIVLAIAEAAAEVERLRPGGPPLLVGDLSGERGGLLLGHRSHRTGRDADLLYYALTPAGAPVESPGFVHYGPDGLAPSGKNLANGFVRLDLDREWLLVRALLRSASANVQWLFLSRPIEALLTEHARARGEPAELVWHAEAVMRQPSDSASHDDHLHLRTACLPDETLSGCEGGGPSWEWLPTVAPFESEPDPELVSALLSDEPQEETDDEATSSPGE